MRILGVDPGTVRMGYGVIEGDPPSPLGWGALSAPARAPLEARLLKLYQGLEQVVQRYQPQEVALEEPFVAANPRAGLAVGRAQAIAVLLAAQHGLPVHYYTPAQVKQQVTSYGAGDKFQIQEAVGLLLRLSSPPQPADAADALAVALCHLYRSHIPSLRP